jgi:ADP-heptose:LPS heptosyltransferase
VRRLILKSSQSPGDILMLTAALRDLHKAGPGEYQTDVRTSADALWYNNPFLAPLQEGAPGVETLLMHYPLIHQSNQFPYHFIQGYLQYLEQQLNRRIPLTSFHGDVYLTEQEKQAPVPGADLGVPERFWILVAGGKFDFTAKWWNPASYQRVVDHFRDQIRFVQCGEQGHWHPPLEGVVNLVGKTSLRDFVRLMYHAEGVVCPVTFAMHLAAAVETKAGRLHPRPCVVLAGGREPPHWEAYPHHQFLSLVGALPCCAHGGCWRSRCQLVGDGDEKDRDNLCENPVQINADLRIPRCMELISPADVIRRIELYFQGGALDGKTTESISPSSVLPHVLAPASAVTRRENPPEQKRPSLCDLLARYPTDKNTTHAYGPIYEAILAPYRDRARAVLEIGVERGGSLAAWRDYFPQATITGIDHNSGVWPPREIADLTRIEFVALDQSNRTSLEAFALSHCQCFDLIIDDGNHVPAVQFLTRVVLWEALRPGGLLIIEDLQNEEALQLMRQLWAELIDLRSVKGRYDDVLAVFRKGGPAE